jgi:CubicO group peptidase (beta-lactamase class C family)
VSFGPLYNDIGFTLDDFIKWEIAIQKNTLLNQSTYDRMWTPVKLNNGSLATFDRLDQTGDNVKAHYGYGWELGTVDGKRNIFHGGYAGTSIQRYPDQGITVIVFTNLCRGKFVPDDLASMILRNYLLN